MKKTGLISSIVLATLVLTACGGGKGKTVDTTKESAQTTQVTTSEKNSESSVQETSTTSTTQTTSSKTTSSTTKESSSNTTEPVANPTADGQAQKVLTQLSETFPGKGLPTAILTSTTNPFLTAATTNAADQNNYNILYYGEPAAIPVNDPQINQLAPIASFNKTTYGSEGEAQQAVQQIVDNGGQAVDLGYGITGHQQGAAGSSFLSWQEGNWQLSVRASNLAGESPQPLSKTVVGMLETEVLPAPRTVGQINLTVAASTDYQNNSVTWQEGTVVYKVTHLDAVQAVKMATSIK